MLDGSQNAYLKIYSEADRPSRQLSAKNAFIGLYPRYALESLGMILISFIGYFAFIQKGNALGVIPLLGTLALGAQRLLPALQQVYVDDNSNSQNQQSLTFYQCSHCLCLL